MNDEDIKKIAAEVARILREKGASFPRQTLGDSVSTGSSGKVFQSPLVKPAGSYGIHSAPAAAPAKQCSGQGDCRL